MSNKAERVKNIDAVRRALGIEDKWTAAERNLRRILKMFRKNPYLYLKKQGSNK